MNEKLINGIFNNTINIVLNGIKDEDREAVMISYKGFLFDNYADTLNENDNLEQVIAIYSNIEIKKWQKKGAREKQAILLKDEDFLKLQEISNIAYKHASRKLGCLISNEEYIPTLTEEQIQAYISEMSNLFARVKEYNIPMAKIYLSEGTLDFYYAAKLSDNMSLRIGRML